MTSSAPDNGHAPGGLARDRPTPAEPVLVPFGQRSGPLRTVFFHALGGGLLPCLGLVAHLARKGPVHGLRAVGPAPGERPDRTVPAMADRYAALVAELPEPPNLLVGWSLGGLLAWETARRLPGPAPDLVLIDSSPGPWDARPDAYRAARAHVLREAAAQLGPDAYRRTAATVDAHVAARRGHRAAGLHPGRALVVACTRGDSPGQAGEWAPLVDDLTVCSLDADHFGALSGEPLRRLTALIDAFAGARRPVRVR